MDTKNPLEKMRESIINARSKGKADVFAQKGIDEEILQISDAFDKYYNIKRSSETESPTKSLGYDEALMNMMSQVFYDETQSEPFSGINELLKKVNEPLRRIKEKLSSDDSSFYISLSSMIVSVAITRVVSGINSYKPPKSYDLHRIDIDGVDKVYRNLIYGALEVFNKLKNFYMNEQSKMIYDKNNSTLISLATSISPKTIQSRRRELNKSGGCMVLIVAISTSILVFTLGLVPILI